MQQLHVRQAPEKPKTSALDDIVKVVGQLGKLATSPLTNLVVQGISKAGQETEEEARKKAGLAMAGQLADLAQKQDQKMFDEMEALPGTPVPPERPSVVVGQPPSLQGIQLTQGPGLGAQGDPAAMNLTTQPQATTPSMDPAAAENFAVQAPGEVPPGPMGFLPQQMQQELERFADEAATQIAKFGGHVIQEPEIQQSSQEMLTELLTKEGVSGSVTKDALRQLEESGVDPLTAYMALAGGGELDLKDIPSEEQLKLTGMRPAQILAMALQKGATGGLSQGGMTEIMGAIDRAAVVHRSIGGWLTDEVRDNLAKDAVRFYMQGAQMKAQREAAAGKLGPQTMRAQASLMSARARASEAESRNKERVAKTRKWNAQAKKLEIKNKRLEAFRKRAGPRGPSRKEKEQERKRLFTEQRDVDRKLDKVEREIRNLEGKIVAIEGIAVPVKPDVFGKPAAVANQELRVYANEQKIYMNAREDAATAKVELEGAKGYRDSLNGYRGRVYQERVKLGAPDLSTTLGPVAGP
jgi:hypothetical protein